MATINLFDMYDHEHKCVYISNNKVADYFRLYVHMTTQSSTERSPRPHADVRRVRASVQSQWPLPPRSSPPSPRPCARLLPQQAQPLGASPHSMSLPCSPRQSRWIPPRPNRQCQIKEEKRKRINGSQLGSLVPQRPRRWR